MATHLVWLRTDLRIHDNLALAAACRDPQAQVLALYIATRGSGVNITWRDGRPLLSPAIYRVCMPRWRNGAYRCG